jgi:hypothetical protein
MAMDDEMIALRWRVESLQRSLEFTDEPTAIALTKAVIADMEARIAALEGDRQQDGEGDKSP